MRREDRLIKDNDRIDEIVRDCDCIRLGFNDNGKVYIVPMNFGYKRSGSGEIFFYLHSAGRKADLIADGVEVGFELDVPRGVIAADKPCMYSMQYSSIIGNGTIRVLSTNDEKIAALNAIMDKYTDCADNTFNENVLLVTKVFEIKVEEMTAKENL